MDVRYDSFDQSTHSFSESVIQSDELNVLQLAIFFELEGLALFIVNEYMVEVGIVGKARRAIDSRFFLASPLSDDEYSAIFTLLLAQKFGQVALSKALSEKIVQYMTAA